jgi:hypothetical protein
MWIVALSVFSGLLVVVAMVAFSARYAARRDQDFALAAREIGLTPLPLGGLSLQKLLADFSLPATAGHGEAKRAYTLKQRGESIILFDYEAGSGEDLVSRTALLATHRADRLPQFLLTQRDLLGQWTGASSGSEAALGQRTSFGRRYRLTSDNEIGARRAFSEGVVSILESGAPLEVESRGDFVLIHAHRVAPRDLKAFCARCLDLLTHFRS